MMTALPVFLCLPLFLSLPAWHFFLLPFFLFSLLIVFCAFPPLPPSSSPAYISWTVRWQRRLEESSQPLIQQNPPPYLSPCFMGSYDSCTLDRRRKRIIAREIKAGKDNTHIHSHALCLSILSVPIHAFSLTLTWQLLYFQSGPKSSKQ